MDDDINKLWGRKRQSKEEFESARPGDHLHTPFQCDVCVFRRLRKADPSPSNSMDDLLLRFIRRANLDAFWSRASSTVANNRRNVKGTIEGMKRFGLPGPFYDPGPSPPYDSFGYEVAIAILNESTKPGKYCDTHKQWESIRKVKSAIASFEKVSTNDLFGGASLISDDKGWVQRFQGGGTGSYWYQRFTAGCKSRMGSDVRPNFALSINLLKRLLMGIDQKIKQSKDDFNQAASWTICGAFIAIAYALSLRGAEGFLLEIKHLEEFKNTKGDLLWFPLIGKLKNGEGAVVHYLRSVKITGRSKIDIQKWRDRLLIVHRLAGRKEGPAICDSDGHLLTSIEINKQMWIVLEELFEVSRDDFPEGVRSKEDIRTYIQNNRTFRKSSDTQAISGRVPQSDIDAVNRWSTKERAKGKAPTESLRLRYAQQELLDACFRRYGKGL